MIVVSDTSPLNYLVLIGCVDVLPRLYHDIHIPAAVMNELAHPQTPLPVRNWLRSPPSWLHVASPTTPAPSVSGLDKGEAEAIALFSELHADALLVDDKKARQFAESQGIYIIGTLAVLELAAEKDLLDLSTTLNALQKTSFQISKSFIQAALQRDAARKQK